jgi:hypothetical protein
MDSYMGQSNNPITLHKYLYANANPVMYTDPSGYFGLGGFSFGGFSSMNYAMAGRTLATNIGPRLLNSLVKPVATAKRVNSMPSFTSLLYNVVKRYCVTGSRNRRISDKCKPDMGLIVYGQPHNELTEHISDAYWTLMDPRIVLTKRDGEYDRTWLNDYRGIGQFCENTQLGSGRECDEYPFASTDEGGKANFTQGNVSIRGIKQRDNSSGGQLLGQLYSKGGVGSDDEFIVLATNSIPISFYVGSNGYVSVSLRE